MCLGALGTQTGGSITRPASYCGVYGFKPTFWSVSLEGVVPLAPSFDHGGVLAASVRDLALMLQPVLGTGTSSKGLTDLTAKIGTPVNKSLGLPGGFFDSQAEPVMAAAMSRLIDRLRGKGWRIELVPLPPAVADIPRNHRLIMSVQAAAYHGERWKRHPDDYPPKLTELLREGLAVPATEYEAARKHHGELRGDMMGRFPDGIAAYLAPATQGPPPDPSTTGTPLFQAPWSYMGLPTVSLPFAWTEDGLPLCVQVAGKFWGEADLVAVAAALEADIGFERREVG
jgi:aspartyl-tRNA(Asn)/glutamyl-tRNA(Gln) amidotransferase subunit A